MSIVKSRVVVPELDLDETLSVEGDVLDSVVSLADKVKSLLTDAGVGDTEFTGAVVFSEFDETLDAFSLGKRKLTLFDVDVAAVRMLHTEVILGLNSELFVKRKPLIVFPPLASDRDAWSSMRLGIESSVAHVKDFYELSLGTEKETIFPLVEKYIERYDTLTYSVVVMWGFGLRSLLRENRKGLNLSDEEFADLRDFADVAANMVQNKVWSSGHSVGLSPSKKVHDTSTVISALRKTVNDANIEHIVQ